MVTVDDLPHHSTVAELASGTTSYGSTVTLNLVTKLPTGETEFHIDISRETISVSPNVKAALQSFNHLIAKA